MTSSASLQRQEENQSYMARKEKEKEDFDRLFDAAKNKNWENVVEEYKKNPSACETKLTKSEQTALHIAITWYDIKSETDFDDIKKMVKAIPEEKAIEVLSLKDTNGNTPLHLAATLGSVCVCKEIALGRWELIVLRNNESETPLFLAAHHGKMDAFFCLCNIYQNSLIERGEEREGEAAFASFCRRKDGNTVLHSAISGGYLRLAYRIIKNYPQLVHRFNVDGESPLHVLARKPNFFKSSSALGFYEDIIYNIAHVPKLMVENFDDYTNKINRSRFKTHSIYPQNYETCVNLCLRLPRAIARVFSCHPPRRTDEENFHDEWNAENHEEQPKEYPPNYDTCVGFFSPPIVLLLQFFTLTGYRRMQRIREKKERDTWATRIMNKLIQLETRYRYDFNGQDPTQNMPKSRHLFGLPVAPPPEDHHEEMIFYSSLRKSKDEEEKVENGSSGAANKTLSTEKKQVADIWMGTPFLLAAKTGITEIVEAIPEYRGPAIFDDRDESGKNVLLLAIEHRQTKVFHLLLKERHLPEYVFNQVDNEGNTARHLAAKFQPNYTWRCPGAAMQVHGEFIWYKHVKKSLPPIRFALYNNKGETPRDVFRTSHQELTKAGDEWLIKTSESCSIVAALIATVAFATTVSVPGGCDDDDSGKPVLVNRPLFNLFSITSLIALYFSLTALVFFLAIIMSSRTIWDFKKELPRKLLIVFFSLFTSIAAILFSFCAGHFFVLQDNLQHSALPIYVLTSVPLTIYAVLQLPYFLEIVVAILAEVPLRSYKRMV